MKVYKIKDNDSFGMVDNKTNALVNYDYSMLQKYKQNKIMLKENKLMKDEINKLKDDIVLIKELIFKSLGK
jgi:Ulp1 family protease